MTGGRTPDEWQCDDLDRWILSLQMDFRAVGARAPAVVQCIVDHCLLNNVLVPLGWVWKKEEPLLGHVTKALALYATLLAFDKTRQTHEFYDPEQADDDRLKWIGAHSATMDGKRTGTSS